MLKLCSTTYFLEVSAHVSLKVATSGFLEVKNIKNSIFDAINTKQERKSLTRESC